ncbi:MAG: cellulase family glycosylhydrolase [Bacteroidales bacterium]|nr:cellulase family glycosylhydrolase [Bacteroidales bacterium]
MALFVAFPVSGQTRAHEINDKLGRGVNLGNSFEAPRNNSWGVSVDAADLENIASQGFSNVRIPIRWNDYASEAAPYTIESFFVDTVQKVVDAALENGLYAIINIHHYDAFNDNPDSYHKNRFFAIWKQISHTFRDYPDSLLFEFLNEPHVSMDAAHWNPIFKQVLDTVRVENPDRICVVGPPDWNNVNSVDKLEWTTDTNMILTVHYYNPFHFTHQGAGWVGDQSDDWLGTTWDSTEAQRQAVIDDFAKVRNFSETHNVPVHVGEFGAYSAADDASRARWTSYCARTFESFGFSWSYWEYQAGFGVYDPALGMWRNFLLNALTERIDPNSILPDPWDVRNGDFSNELNGWNFQVQGEAVATAEVQQETATVNVNAVDGSNWHVQMSQTGIQLIQWGEYSLTFDAWSDTPGMNITVYLGKSTDPYNAYTEYKNFELSGENARYELLFTMEEPSDKTARLVFDLGYSTGTIYLDSIEMKQLFVPVLVEQIQIGPDPAQITEKGDSLQLTVEILPEAANSKEVSWSVRQGENIAEVTSYGMVKAKGVADGEVLVEAKAKDGSGVTGLIKVEVSNQLLVESISLDPTTTVIDDYRGTARIFNEVLPENASNKTLLWETTSGGNIAEISQSGLLEALGTGDGDVTVRAATTDGSNLYDEVVITLTNQVMAESVEILAPATVIDVLQGSLQLEAEVLPENASRKMVAWNVVDGKPMATIDQDGLLTATGDGNGIVIVRASANDGSGVYDEMEITLTNQNSGITGMPAQPFHAWTKGEKVMLEYPVAGKAERVLIYTLGGKRIIDEAIPQGSSAHEIDMTGFSEGIYVVRILKSGELITGKVTFFR